MLLMLLVAGALAEEPAALNRPSAPPANAQQRQWIDTVVRQNYEGVRRCYIDGLLVDPRLAGMLKVRIQLGGDGVPVWGEVELSSLDAPRVEACMLSALKSMDYSRVDAHEPFVFGHTLVFFPEDYPTGDQLMKKNLRFVEACYAQASEDHELRGVLEVRFQASAGELLVPEVSVNTSGNEELEDCVRASFGQWKVKRKLSGRYTVLMRLIPEDGVRLYGLQ